MARIVLRPGYIFRFPTDGGQHGYCQWLPHDVRIFLTSTSEELSPEEILRLPVAFRVVVFRDTPRLYGWQKVGVGPVPPDCAEPQTFAKQDPINKALSVYRAGEERPASHKEVVGLETLAVWAHPHIVERLLAQLAQKPSKFLASMQITR